MCGYSSFKDSKRIFVDKYFGRQLKADGLQEMFLAFFQHDLEIVAKMLPKVTYIRDAIAKTQGIKFNGSSLIMAYCKESGLVNCKIVDFQNVMIDP